MPEDPKKFLAKLEAMEKEAKKTEDALKAANKQADLLDKDLATLSAAAKAEQD